MVNSTLPFEDVNMNALHRKNPMLSHFYNILPRNIKECFQWAEYMATSSSSIFNGIEKLSELPVTTITYGSSDGDDEEDIEVSNGWKNILEKKLRIKSVLCDIAYNGLVYGNVFVSVYSPFSRKGVCPACKQSISLKKVKDLKIKKRTDLVKDNSDIFGLSPGKKSGKNIDAFDDFDSNVKKETQPVVFIGTCPGCGEQSISFKEVKDTRIRDVENTNIVIWDPSLMSIKSNKVTGKNVYYYTLPSETKKSILSNDKDAITTLPIGMLDTALTAGSHFQFDEGYIYHHREKYLAGISTAWGIPLAISALSPFLSMMIIRNANDVIASDYLKPLRIAFPVTRGSGSDLYNHVGGTSFVNSLNSVIKQWKIDPAHVATTPFEIGFQTVLGEGKLLSLDGQIESAERSIAASIGIPYEFIFGGLSYSAQGASLRLLESKLSTLTAGLNEILEFIMEKTSISLGKEPVSVSMIPFKLIDDLQEKATIVQMALQGNGNVSKDTAMAMFNIDPQAEKRKIMEGQKQEIKSQLELQQYQKEVTTSIEQKAKDAEMMEKSQFSQLNQQSLMEEAQQTANELMQLDDGERRSRMDAMSKDNYIMYGTVRAIMDRAHGKGNQQGGMQ